MGAVASLLDPREMTDELRAERNARLPVQFNTHSWHLVMAEARREELAELRLGNQDYAVWLPMAKVAKAVGVRVGPIAALAPAFPGYLFVGVPPGKGFLPILSTRGVREVVRMGDRPVPAPVAELKSLFARFKRDGGELDLMPVPLGEGDKVRIEDGSFAGWEGLVAKDQTANGRIKILLDLFGRATTVGLSVGQVALLERSADRSQ